MKDEILIDLAGQESRLLARTRYGSKLQMLERMAFRAPESVQAWTRLTAALVEAGELDRAAITAAVLDPQTRDWQTLVLRSQVAAGADPAQALKLAQEAVAIAPREHHTHLQLARCHLATGDHEQHGLAASQMAIWLSPRDPETIEVRAHLLRLHGREAHAARASGRNAALAASPARQPHTSTPSSGSAGSVYVMVLICLGLASIGNGIGVFAGVVEPSSGLPYALLLALAVIAMIVARGRS